MLSSLASAAGLRSRKKFHFNVSFCLQELLNCTFVSGVIFAKIRLKDGGSFTEASRRVEVQGHCVKWLQSFSFPCKMYASSSTAELEPCVCKISVRRETKGGRSYKKLGFVKINLAEYAGAGEMQRKYLLESYNEHKRKPDNSILKVKISLRLTLGDILFKAPRAPVWELSEAEDEGIQADAQSTRSRATNPRASMASTASGLSGADSAGGSLQDMRRKPSLSGTKDNGRVMSVSASSLRGQSSSSEYNSAGSEDSIQEETAPEETASEEKEPKGECGEGGGATESGSVEDGSSKASEPLPPTMEAEPSESEPLRGAATIPRTLSPRTQRRKDKELMDLLQLEERPRSIGTSDLRVQRPNGTSMLSLPGTMPKVQSHRRQASLGIISSGSFSATASPSRLSHKRHFSMSMTGSGAGGGGASSKSTSAYSTMSERSMGSWEGHETESICSQRSRLSLFPSTKVEQSRKDAKTVIDELMQQHDLTKKEEEEEGGSGGLKIYVDKNRGTVTVAGPNLDRKYGKAIEFTNQTSRAASSRLRDKGVAVSSSKQGSAGQSNSTGADKPKAASTSPEPSSSAS